VTAAAGSLDARFRAAVALMDAGDVPALERLLAADPGLAGARLEAPGAWLRDQVGGALDDFFARPWLLWFVAEDPVRNGTLPANAAEVAAAVLRAARAAAPDTVRAQVDQAVRLVAWSWIARDCGVQIALLDLLLDAGASPDGITDAALVNRNHAAARHLLARGARPTLATALCLGRWDDLAALPPPGPEELQVALVLSALNGRVEGVRRALEMGAEVNSPSRKLYSHGTPLHHAVCSGSLETVRLLAEAGASLGTADAAWHATPLGWAEFYEDEHHGTPRAAEWTRIAAFLRERAG
jgi:peptide-methionine (S)-S-oxide reductase